MPRTKNWTEEEVLADIEKIERRIARLKTTIALINKLSPNEETPKKTKKGKKKRKKTNV
jgi:tetrahydromethanopterin S-methyltransferase subunit B